MSDWRLSGYTEAGIGVIDPDPWVRYFRAFGEWEVVTEGQTDPAILGAWGDHTSSQPQEVLLARPGQAFGQVRLFCHADPVPATNRSEAAAWDSGGIFDLDIRVADLSASVRATQNLPETGAVHAPVFGVFQHRKDEQGTTTWRNTQSAGAAGSGSRLVYAFQTRFVAKHVGWL